MREVTFDRKKLYNEVWKEPVITVAKRYGLSDNGLRKYCKKLNIPLPPVGYWAKIKAGQKVEIPPLPASTGIEKLSTTIYGNDNVRERNKNGKLGFLSTEEKNNLMDFCKNIQIPPKLNRIHPLVETTIKYLKSKAHETNEKTLKNVLNVKTSSETLGRMSIIMDTLLKSLEELGYEVHNEFKKTIVITRGIRVSIGLKEKMKQIIHEAPPKRDPRDYYYYPRYEQVYNGELILFIDSWHSKGKKNWRDMPQKPLEEQIGDFIIGLVEASEDLRIIYTKMAEEQRERENRERIIRENRERKEREIEEFQVLQEKAAAFIKSKEIVAYLDAMELNMSSITEEDEKMRILNYIEWGRSKANWLNPLVASEDSVLGTKWNKGSYAEKESYSFSNNSGYHIEPDDEFTIEDEEESY